METKHGINDDNQEGHCESCGKRFQIHGPIVSEQVTARNKAKAKKKVRKPRRFRRITV